MIFGEKPVEGVSEHHIVGLTLDETVYEIGRVEVEDSIIPDTVYRESVAVYASDAQRFVAAKLIYFRPGITCNEARRERITGINSVGIGLSPS